VHDVTEDYVEAARAGLRFVQAIANKNALEALNNARQSEYNETRERYEAGEQCCS
jgi:hypothetical protein